MSPRWVNQLKILIGEYQKEKLDSSHRYWEFKRKIVMYKKKENKEDRLES